MQKIKQYLLPTLIALSAISVSASAAFYSVSGLSKLFAGASLEVVIMASSLEVAKLVIASLLYQYWGQLNKILRTYLTIAAGVLILITSMGIYGFLSAAYQETASKAGNVDLQVALIEVKKNSIEEQLKSYTIEKESINAAVSELRSGLANNKLQYTDNKGNLITTTSSSNRRALESQLEQATSRQASINTKMDELSTELFKYETQIVETKTNNEVSAELGPLKYLSGLTGIPMDRIINWLLLVIIFVFDPLAISLVVAANFAFSQIRNTPGIEVQEQSVDLNLKEPEILEQLPGESNTPPPFSETYLGSSYQGVARPSGYYYRDMKIDRVVNKAGRTWDIIVGEKRYKIDKRDIEVVNRLKE